MLRRIISVTIVIATILGALFFFANICRAKADETIHIKADGSIDPATAPISTGDNVTYLLTENINSSIVVERNDIIIDGAEHTLQGNRTYGSDGIFASHVQNVTIKNMTIKDFDYNVHFDSSFHSTLSGNNITGSKTHGLWFYNSSNNEVYGNDVTYNGNTGILLSLSYGNIVYNNSIENNLDGVVLYYHSSNNTVYGNRIVGNSIYGVEFWFSSNNVLSNNAVRGNDYGVWFDNSLNDSALDNSVTDNVYGIYLFGASNDTLSKNILDNNTYSLTVDGVLITHYMHSIDTSNLVNGKPIYYLTNQQDLTINDSTYPQVGYLALINSTEIKIDGLTLANSGQGLLFAYTDNSVVINNKLANNIYGILLTDAANDTICGNGMTSDTYGLVLDLSSNSTVCKNNITDCYYGIQLEAASNNVVCGNFVANNGISPDHGRGFDLDISPDNIIYENNIVNNSQSISDQESYRNKFYHNNCINNTEQPQTGGGSSWDNSYPSGGNYWSDYNGTDSYSGPYQNETGYDWIGDTPYSIYQGNADRYPLMQPFSPETDDIRIAYRTLLGDYNALAANLSLLNSAYQQNLLDYYSLQANYTSLQNGVNSLNTSCNSLNSSFNFLNSAYDNLNTAFNKYKISTQNEQSYFKDSLYVLIGTTATFIVATIYFAAGKPKTKTKAEAK